MELQERFDKLLAEREAGRKIERAFKLAEDQKRAMHGELAH